MILGQFKQLLPDQSRAFTRQNNRSCNKLQPHMILMQNVYAVTFLRIYKTRGTCGRWQSSKQAVLSPAGICIEVTNPGCCNPRTETCLVWGELWTSCLGHAFTCCLVLQTKMQLQKLTLQILEQNFKHISSSFFFWVFWVCVRRVSSCAPSTVRVRISISKIYLGKIPL